MDLAQNFQELFTLTSLVSLLTLAVLEIVLGIDNIIFVSIIAGKLPKNQQRKARVIGLTMALLFRVVLLFCITWIIGLKEDLFTFFELGFSGRDIILFTGGIFLLVKTTSEMHTEMEGEEAGGNENSVNLKKVTFNAIVAQIIFIDIIFSFDSILTAVGIVDNLLVMILAVVISMLVMMAFAGAVSDFIHKHPTLKMLALAFLLMIGFLLVLESFDVHVPKPYIYSAMAFAFLVEMLNMRLRKKKEVKK